MASSAETRLHPIDEEHDENFGYAMQLALGSALPMSLHAAIELGVFEIIAKAGPESKLSASEITAEIPDVQNPDAAITLDRVLRLLASHNVLGCSLNGLERLYSLNPVSKYFVPNQDGISLGPFMALIQDKVFLDSWTKLKDAVLEGGSPFNKFHGTHCFGYSGLDSRFNHVFNTAMFHHTNLVITKILETYKGFKQLKQLIDVGGGLGHTLKAIISKYPHLKGINFDLPHVVKYAPAIPGVEHVAGDMFESVPKGEAIFMKWILHDWSDEHCLRLLKNCYEALPDDGKVIVMDAVLPVMPETGKAAKANFQTDLVVMTVYEGGTERTEHEFLAMATAAGFRGIRYVCCACNFWIMEFFK
ncbi:anthranilate N-methyltransferase [Ricinus communis]|uniref:caffeate O-methyltransferase n=1 Tax=Ricinus communis TaxID=3988 RepID=B9RMU8_RICCO|nr:anthranilate N-methyltransferase [Ricinus communis]EEF47071.1 o-methyltransferase, putative [Ricinus communis]|eukprot:XP_002515087.1 anthranilate N-methyltransferase [Ricinus communis]